MLDVPSDIAAARPEFVALIDPHRRELLVHCYRMLASLEDAEDALQEILLSAWRGLDAFAGRASIRTWLYRIATNHCVNVLRSQRRAEGRGEALARIQPLPDDLVDPPDPAADPEASALARESISLAFISALQLLPPRQRAALVLRDVLGFETREIAEQLDMTADAVTSALARARAAVAAEPRPSRAVGPADRALLDRFVAAFVGEDVDALVALLADDVRVRMPPLPLEVVGREAAASFLASNVDHRRTLARMVPVATNGQIAFVAYSGDGDIGRLTGLLIDGVKSQRFDELTWFDPRSLRHTRRDSTFRQSQPI